MRRAADTARFILQAQIGVWLLVALTQAVKIVTSLQESSVFATWGGLVASVFIAVFVAVVFVRFRAASKTRRRMVSQTLLLCAAGNLWVMLVAWQSFLLNPGTSALVLVILGCVAGMSVAAAMGLEAVDRAESRG